MWDAVITPSLGLQYPFTGRQSFSRRFYFASENRRVLCGQHETGQAAPFFSLKRDATDRALAKTWLTQCSLALGIASFLVWRA